MEEEKIPCKPPETPGLDREVFERVWRRVMPEDRPGCPIVLNSQEQAAPAELEAVGGGIAQAPTVLPPAVITPAAPPAEAGAGCGCNGAVPMPDDVPCLGASSAVYGALLQQFIDQELSSFKTYQLMARRATGNGSRVLSGIAADERRHAKRLSAAYFLISGVRYWPIDRAAPSVQGTYLGALRERFGAEQRAEGAYLSSAEETTDPCLRELYRELAGDENAHAWLLRGILEQL